MTIQAGLRRTITATLAVVPGALSLGLGGTGGSFGFLTLEALDTLHAFKCSSGHVGLDRGHHD